MPLGSLNWSVYVAFNYKPHNRVKMDIQELLERYAAGERDFSFVRSFKNLKVPQSQNLSDINFQGCRFHEVDFSQVNLAGAELTGIVCSATSFRNANLRGANISAATFWEETDFSEADLSFANLSKLTVEDAIFQRAILISSDLSESDIKGADFQAANLTQSNLRDAWISSSNFRDANLAGTDLSIMKDWSLNETNGANFDEAVMPGSQSSRDESTNTTIIDPSLLSLISTEDIEIMKKDYLRFGDRLGAIKFFRGKTGLDLAPAKSAVDSIMDQMQ
jgi:uncharacterized protein YjbI with pentapeptide repeats